MTSRRGISKLGCLVAIAIVAALAYFSLDFGRAYWANAEYKDEMKQELQFHSDQTDSLIAVHMKLVADSLGLPDDAGAVSIARDVQARSVTMDAHYDVTVKVPGYQRVLHFDPHVTDTY